MNFYKLYSRNDKLSFDKFDLPVSIYLDRISAESRERFARRIAIAN